MRRRDPPRHAARIVWWLVVGRALCALPVAVAILLDQRLVAAALLVSCAVSDWADGWLARRWQAGTLLRPADDCLADMSVLLSAVIACTWKGMLSPAVLAVVVASFAFFFLSAGGVGVRNRLGRAWGPVLGATVLSALHAPSQLTDVIESALLPTFAFLCAAERTLMWHRMRQRNAAAG